MWHRIGKEGNKYWGKRGAGIVFTDGDSVLLLKRAEKGDHKGQWGIPGGKAEEEETFLGTAQRETKEEIGHLPKCHRITHIDSNDGHHLFRTYICVIREQFPVELSDEHDDWGWFAIDRLKEVELHDKMNNIIDNVISIIRSRTDNKREMSGFAEYVSLSEFMGATGVVAGTHPKKKSRDWNWVGAPGSTGVSPKEEPIKSWPKKKKK